MKESNPYHQTLIKNNITRWKRAAVEMPFETYLVVDIVGFRLLFFEAGKLVLESKALVGQIKNPTPTFGARIEKIVLNPTWIIPSSIVISEAIPRIQKDADLLLREKIDIYLGKKQVSPEQINLKNLSKENFPFVFKQRTGPGNPLGDIKFVSPNPHSVFVHATAEPELFASTQRTVSHGCVRIEKALDLAGLLLKRNGWDSKKIITAIKKGKEIEITLDEKIPIYFGYWTAWVNQEHELHFREDIYGWDRKPITEELGWLDTVSFTSRRFSAEVIDFEKLPKK